MSSLRNAVKRRTHKERSQPSDRQRLGLLEKHKDYVLRAKDFHKKERAIQILKEKAAFRNPDEFYFKMINSKVVDGVHRSTKIRRRHADNEILRTKNQDIRVAQRVMQSERKRVEKLTTSLHLTGHPSVNNHTYFAENRLEEQELKAALNSKGPATEGLSASFKKKQHSAKRNIQLSTEREAKMKEFVVDTQKNIMGKPKSIRMQERQK